MSNYRLRTTYSKWFDSIPEHWKLTKLKFIGNVICGGTPATANEDYWSGPIPWIQSGKVQNNVIKESSVDKYISEQAYKESSTKMVKQDSVLIAITGATCSNIGYLTFDTTVNQSIVGIEPENFNARLLFHMLSSQKEQILFHQSGGAQGGVTKGDMMNIFIPLPPPEEQTQIARYLDYKTAKIDKLIEKKQRLIELLEEERTAIINQAVTKGLNPDAPMKDSGIEWLGEIPEHWEVSKFGFEVSIKRGAGYQYIEQTEDNEYEPVIRISDFNSFDPLHAIPRQELNKYRIRQGDILIAGTGASAGICILTTPEMMGMVHSYNALRLIPKNSDSEFLFNCLRSHTVNEQKNLAFTGSAQPFLDVGRISNLIIARPPVDEQKQIASHIQEICGRIYLVINKAEREIELLEEYKTVLISEVVTGKVDVRDEVIPE